MNKLHIYTGEGKGKTTAAMGLALRSLGHGNRVLVAQFMKKGNSGELVALRRFEGAVVMVAEPMEDFSYRMDAAQKENARARQSAFLERVLLAVGREKPALIVLDELGVALTTGMVAEAAAGKLVDASLESGETVVTGRTVPEWLEARADYLSRIAAQRHPFAREGLPARRGIEW